MLVKIARFCARSARSFATVAASESPFHFERLAGEDEGIVLFRMNRAETRNAISRQMLSDFCEAVESVRYDRTARVIVIKSDVPGAFCAGADLKERATMKPQDVPAFVNRARTDPTLRCAVLI